MRPSAASSRGSRYAAILLLLVLANLVFLLGLLIVSGRDTAYGSRTGPSGAYGLPAVSVASSSEAGHSGASSPLTVTTEPVRPTGAALLPTVALPAGGEPVHVPILAYHHVADHPPFALGPYAQSLTIAPQEFEEQVACLTAAGRETISFVELYLALAGSSPLERGSVLLTFDDGGADLYESAFPFLKAHGLTATFFVITGEVGKPGYLTWAQLAEMKEAGMSIQSHTVSHPNLTSLSDEQLALQLRESKRAIEQSLGEPVFVLCYPGGFYDERVQAAAAEAGYLLAVTTVSGAESDPAAPLALPRVRVQPGLTSGGFARLVE